ncbi:MAG: DUF4070 domain-containing protein, partial [Thermoanaerobaculia bacterium]
FIGNKPKAHELLQAIIEYQKKHDYPFRFGTEASLNLSQDEELMRRFREANFQWVFIGIESPDEESLRETLKLQNTREDMFVSLRRIYANSIDVFAGFIIGFDHDTVATFDHQHKFITNSGIQMAMVGMLTALPRTPLYKRLEADGRLLEGDATDNTRLYTNVVPKSMTMDEMRTGYQELYGRLLSDRGIANRILAKARHLVPSRGGNGYTLPRQLLMAWRLLANGIRPGGLSRWWHFTRTLLFVRPAQLPQILGEWVTGLSMRKYAEKYLLAIRDRETVKMERALARLRSRLARFIDEGALEVTLENVRTALPNLSLTVRTAVDSSALAQSARDLRRWLRATRATITLRIEGDARAAERLLQRLQRYGDRVSLSLSEAVPVVNLDWSRFEVTKLR